MITEMTTQCSRDVPGICGGGQALECSGKCVCTSVSSAPCDVPVCDRIGCTL